MFITDAIMHGMPPHIAQLVAGHRDINTTMGYKAVYPEEIINGHRAFIARRRELRPSQEYRTPSDEEWAEFLGHFERRKVALGDCGRSYDTPCIHEHSCLRCPLLRPDPDERGRLTQILDNLQARIAEAETHRWFGEAEGLKVSLAGARSKLAQMDQISVRRNTTVNLGVLTTKVRYTVGGWLASECAVAAVMIVGVDEPGVGGDAFGLAEVEPGVGPFLAQGPVGPFDLAVGLWPVGAGSFVCDRAQGLGEKL